MNIEVFKIYRPTDGLYSTGGYSPRWTKKGKTWNDIAGIKLHLRGALDKFLKPADHIYQSKEESIRRNKSTGFIYKDCTIRGLSEKGFQDKPVKMILDEMYCKGYGQNKDQTLTDRLVELYGEDFIT